MHGFVGKAGRGMLILALLPVGGQRGPVEMLISTLTLPSINSESTERASPCLQDARSFRNDAVGAALSTIVWPFASICLPSSAEVAGTWSAESKLAPDHLPL